MTSAATANQAFTVKKETAAGDYPRTKGALCIHAGVNLPNIDSDTDLDGHARIVEGTVDMGAYESPPHAVNAVSECLFFGRFEIACSSSSPLI